MHKYKVTASKSQKQYTFVISEENEKLARRKVHQGGYSILSVELFDEASIKSNTFIFEAEKGSEIKSGKVAWNDIFKIYLKLKDWLGYNILKLYSIWDRAKTDIEKASTLKELDEQYSYYKSINKEENKEENKQDEDSSKNKINIDSFYLKKELEETYKLIDFVLDKLNKLLINEKYKLEESKKEKLKNLFNSLIKIKSSTNITKLRTVWEAVLLKIWEIELDYLEKHKNKEWKQFLSETNNLLKKIWSEKKFKEEDKDLWKKIEKIVLNIKTFFIDLKKEKNKEKKKRIKTSDKRSYEYLRTLIFLNKYKQKLKQNNVEILKNILAFIVPWEENSNKKQDLIVRRKVIKQNIYLFRAKLEGKVFSYTKVIKWFDHFIELIFKVFNYIKDYFFFVVLSYAILFLLFLNLSYYDIFPVFEKSLNQNWIFYFIIFLFVYFAIYFSRWIYSLIINSIILFLVTIFSLINF